MEVFLVESIFLLFICFLALFIRRLKIVEKNQKQHIDTDYDSDGFNRYGYNSVGRNRQGKYNRYYNVKCYQTGLYSEEGFLDIRKNPLYLTHHARRRMQERMRIYDEATMKELAFGAYQYGKSKFQVMKSEKAIIEDREQRYGNSIILIYRGYCYAFTENNGLKTVYKNDSIQA